MDESTAEILKLQNQVCFPLYAASRLVVQAYRPLLADLGLTYPQYLVMLVLWEQDGLSVNALGARLHLDSGTLTPLLKRMETHGLLTRSRSTEDGRVVHLHLTDAGTDLRERAQHVPGAVLGCVQPPEGLDLALFQQQLVALLQAVAE